MRPIDVDLSASLINRTAVFNIGRDVAAILAGSGEFAVRHRFLGEVLADRPDPEKAAELLDRVDEARAAAAADRLSGWMPPLRGPASGRAGRHIRCLILDPLYVLFAPLSPHDIVVCHDLSTLTHPEWHDPVVGRLYEEAFRRILEVGPNLFVVSNNTADTLYANFGPYRSRLTVVPNYTSNLIEQAAGRHRVPPLRTASPYMLFVGSLEARKNVVGAIDAFAMSGLADDDYRLLIVGGDGYGAAAIRQRAGEVPGVILAGFQSAEELCATYSAATGFVYPSYLEGFGVPLLEAMAFGLPCVATTAGASPEVGGPLVFYRDPDDLAGIAEDMRGIAGMAPGDRQRIAAGLRRRARSEFSFEQFADRLLAAVRAVVDGA